MMVVSLDLLGFFGWSIGGWRDEEVVRLAWMANGGVDQATMVFMIGDIEQAK